MKKIYSASITVQLEISPLCHEYMQVQVVPNKNMTLTFPLHEDQKKKCNKSALIDFYSTKCVFHTTLTLVIVCLFRDLLLMLILSIVSLAESNQ